ncbi:MAG TPA: SDR family oxidoreductase, partial [Bacteroidetes bacterium]|nr:SDR family oxidoreductase [Bacteroidota bacterium]
DILVTNAGGPPAGFFEDIDDESWALGFERTMMSAIRLIRAALPHMREKKWGRIVAITSISVKQPIPGLLLSNALRPGVVGMAKSLADEVALDGITINAVCPGWTATERVDEILQARAESRGISKQEAAAEIEQSIPMRRMAKPEELAAMVTFLCSARASYITGTTIQVDGGAFRGLM